MNRKLGSNLQILKLASDLKLTFRRDPLPAIIRHCSLQIESFLSEFPCSTLTELLEVAAARLDTLFLEICSDEDLLRAKAQFLQKRETAFALLDKELRPDVYAITLRRQFPQ